MTSKPYDLVVIGGGSGGLVTAAGGAAFGLRVALFEMNAMGGDCLNTGCVPSKALLHSSRLAAAMRDGARAGLPSFDPPIDFSAVMAAVRAAQDEIAPNDSVERFRSLGVEVFRGGAARFLTPRQLTNGEVTVAARRTVIATGARAHVPPVEGLTEAGYLTNETVFRIGELPKRLAVFGGGPIGCELGQALARLGSAVTILQQAPRLLPREDADVAAVLEKSLVDDGVQVWTNASPKRVERRGPANVVHVETPSGTRALEVDEILVAAGRKANVEALGLEAIGVAMTPRGITVDDRLRTTAKNVWAVGDVVGAYQFTHAANWMARLVLRNILFPGFARIDWSTLPWCTFTEPEVARVGLSEADARAAGIAIDVYRHPFSEVDRAVCERATTGFAKAIVAQGSDRILGAAIVGPRAGELIHELVVAKRHGIGLGGLSFSRTIHVYPTYSEAISRLGDAYLKTRLTPSAKAFATWWAGSE